MVNFKHIAMQNHTKELLEILSKESVQTFLEQGTRHGGVEAEKCNS